MEKLSLGDRIKAQEKAFQTYIKEDENVILRLDGDSFSKFTKGFRKPFDSILVETMLKTTEALFTRFSASVGYTQSDEITLVIPASKELVLGGKVQKLASLSAGFASAKFNQFLMKEILKEKENISEEFFTFLMNEKVGNAWFDSRVFAFTDIDEVFNTVLWRARDAERNSISMLAYANFSHKKLLNKNSQEKREMLDIIGVSWDKLSDDLKYGTLIKRELFEKEAGVFRRRLVRIAKKLHYSQENVDLMLSKEL